MSTYHQPVVASSALSSFLIGEDRLSPEETALRLRREFDRMSADRYDSFRGIAVRLLLRIAEDEAAR